MTPDRQTRWKRNGSRGFALLVHRRERPGAETAEVATTHASAAAVAATCMLAALCATWRSVASLIDHWSQAATYQYGYVIAAVSIGWLIVRLRELRAVAARFCGAAAVVLCLALFGWVIACIAASNIVQHLLLPVVVGASAVAGIGWKPGRPLIAPITYMYFAIPVWDYLLPTLQQVSTVATETLLHLAGVTAVVREHIVIIPEGTFSIDEGCSGLRYLMVTLALAFIAASINRMRGSRWVVYMASCCLLALVTNWLRIFVIIYAGHASDMQHYLVATEHQTFGNAIFLALIVSLLAVTRALSPPLTAAIAATRDPHPTNGVPRTSRYWSAAVVPLSMLLIALVFTEVRLSQNPVTPSLGSLPNGIGEWSGPLAPDLLWAPRYAGPSDQVRAAYLAGSGAVVEVYVNVYGDQRQGRELVSDRNTLYAPGDWKRSWARNEPKMEPDAAARQLAYSEASTASGDSWTIAHVFTVGGRVAASEGLAQAAYGVRSILRPAPSGIVALAVRCLPDCDAARKVLTRYWTEMGDSVRSTIPSTAATR